jgi:hypothetical protein
MNSKGFGRKLSWPTLKYNPDVCLERLRKPTENLSQNRWPPVLDLHPRPPEYETGVLSTRRRHSVACMEK